MLLIITSPVNVFILLQHRMLIHSVTQTDDLTVPAVWLEQLRSESLWKYIRTLPRSNLRAVVQKKDAFAARETKETRNSEKCEMHVLDKDDHILIFRPVSERSLRSACMSVCFCLNAKTLFEEVLQCIWKCMTLILCSLMSRRGRLCVQLVILGNCFC